MSSADKNLSSYSKVLLPDASTLRIGIVVSEWNEDITKALLEGAMSVLKQHGIKASHIISKKVPGSFELPLGAQLLANYAKVDAVICLGCVITGETRHAEYISHAVASGLTQLSIIHSKPFVFGLLTPDNMKQAKARSGGKHGNKGVEAAITALRMIALKKELVK